MHVITTQLSASHQVAVKMEDIALFRVFVAVFLVGLGKNVTKVASYIHNSCLLPFTL